MSKQIASLVTVEGNKMLRSVVPESLTVDAGSRCEEREPDNEDLELPRSKRARVRLLSHRSLKEEAAEGGCSEYEEITVEVDGDYLFTEEEESFETEEVTYQVTKNTIEIQLYLLIFILQLMCFVLVESKQRQ